MSNSINDVKSNCLEVFLHSNYAFSVFVSIKRRQFEQVKEAVPIILNVLKAVSLESDDAEPEGVFDRAVEIANSIYEVCNKLVC